MSSSPAPAPGPAAHVDQPCGWEKIELVARHVVSQLSLDEFANVDLDAMTEEQDPPSFKAARKRDRDRLLQVRSIKIDSNQKLFNF